MTTTLRNFSASIVMLGLALPTWASSVSAVIRLKEKVSMENLAQNVLDSHSPHFGIPYTVEEIRDLSAPSASQYAMTLGQLRQLGFQIVSESPTHLWISVKGDSSLFEKTFSTRLEETPTGRHQLSKAVTPRFLSGIAGVAGLDSQRKAHPKFKSPQALSSKPGGITPAKIKSAYGFNPIYSSKITGLGQHIAIATYDGFNIDDVKYFYSNLKLSPGPKVDQVQFNGKPAYEEGSAEETELDAEFSGMIAPGASVHVFASAENSDAGEAQMFTAILDDNRAKVVNYSWGSCETYLTSEHQAEMSRIFSRAVAQGVNILVASGDSGSDSCQDGSTLADWPAAHPQVVAVGGTTFSVKNGVLDESGWDGSGGGISSVFDLPSWQNFLGTPYSKRSYPDVSFNADPNTGQAIYTHVRQTVGWAVIGGTSMAAPQWAGFLALVGQARTQHKKNPVGYLNPILYATSVSQRKSLFNDVIGGQNGAYLATADWDAVTGFGTMKANSLFNFLVAQ